MTPAEVDFSIARTARLQHGVISHAQALDAGATDRMIEGRLSTRRWAALAPAVYALAGNPFTRRRQCMAAVLGEVKAVISRRAAATLHEFPGFRPGPIDVTVPRWSNHRSPLAVVHESNLVQRTTVDRIPLRPRPAMVRQAPLPWRPRGASRVDVLIPSWSAIIEADGRRWHTRVRDFEVDQERNNEAVLNGFRTLRFTWSQITTRPEWLRREVDRLRPDRIVAAA